MVTRIATPSWTITPTRTMVPETLRLAIAVGDFHTCGFTIAVSTMCWGYELAGYLGISLLTLFSATPLEIGVQ